MSRPSAGTLPEGDPRGFTVSVDRRRAAFALLVAAGAGVGYLALVLTSSHADPQGVVQSDAPGSGLLIGWCFAGAGVVASVLRPCNRFGLLLYATGLAWFLSALMASESPALFTMGLLAAPWWLGVFLHALLAFPSGRLEGRWRRLLVGLLYVDVTVMQALRLLFTRSADLPGCGDCPDNVILLSDRPEVAAAILVVQQAAIGSVVIGGTLVLLVRQWLEATAPQRRVLAPVLVTGSVCLVVQAVALASAPFSVRQSVGWLGAVAFAAVPLAFLFGLLRQRLDRSAVGRLVVDLGATREGDHLDDLLRRTLKDPSLRVAYWRAETRQYVDSTGRPFAMPAPDDGEAVTVVERDGRRIAALVHDGALADDPALVSGVVAAAGLALENARLHAAVRAQLEELRASRRRLVEAGDRERLRLERNLHDGAQQRLLAVSMLLSQLERAPGDDPRTRELAAEAQAELTRSLSELRDLAAGLHPAVLTDHGLAVALDGLAAMTPFPVELVVDLPRRPPPAAEVAAYYVIAEALANVVKHAAATRVSVRVCDDGSTLRVEVEDDGVGGVDAQSGSGLQGLSDRVAALDGRLVVTSPPGKGTTVQAMIPCA
jgi:signal transduction histidine kinase